MPARQGPARALVAAVLVAALVAAPRAHSFLSHPSTISTLDGCRIGGTGGFIGNCPGPCPNYNIAADADPTNPAAVYKRGSYNRVVWTRNNHEGGFVRWTIVPIDKMWDKATHDKMAFEYTCWNIGRFNCNEFDFHRDCNYDRQNEAFSKMLYIPPIYPDGDYVLGYTWFGGGVGWGHFGDYYDCSYIRIEGGDPVQHSWQPTFQGGGGSAYSDGCEATVDSLGQCWKEPCVPIRKTAKLVPAQFKDGAVPDRVQSSWYAGGITEHNPSVRILALRLVDANTDAVISHDLTRVVNLHRSDEITLLAETEGDVDYVQWYVNGRQKGRDYAMPYTIAGDFRGDFYPWMHPLFNRRIRVSAKAVARDGSYCWTSVELRFHEVYHGGVKSYHAVSYNAFMSQNGHIDVSNARPAPPPAHHHASPHTSNSGTSGSGSSVSSASGASGGTSTDSPRHFARGSGTSVGSKRSAGGAETPPPSFQTRSDVGQNEVEMSMSDFM